VKKKVEQRSLPPILGVATLAAETVDKEARTVEMVFYSGAPVLRYSWEHGDFELELEVSKKATKLGRLNGGAPLIDSHRTYAGVGGIFGVVEKARIENGELRGRVRFSKRDDVEPVWQDVIDGVIRSVSIGTWIYEMKEVTEDGAPMKRFRATSWEPFEVSLVPVPADAGAHVLQASTNGESRTCVVEFSAEASAKAPNGASAPRGDAMRIKIRLLADVDGIGKLGEVVEIQKDEFDAELHEELTAEELAALESPKGKAAKSTPADPKADQRLHEDTIEADKERARLIREAAEHFELDDLWAQNQIRTNKSHKQVLALAAEERARRAPKMVNDIGVGEEYESAVWRSEQMALALAARAERKDAPASAKQYARFSFSDCALEYLKWHRRGAGLHPRADAARIFELAFHTGSDLPLIYQNALNKVLLPAYNAAPATFPEIAVEREFRDYRPHHFIRAGDFPVPLEVGEHGEYQNGSLSENDEQVTLAKYGRILGLTEEMLVNDDIGAFADLAQMAGRRVRAFENSTFYAICIAPGSGLGPVLSDSERVFAAAHTNLTAGGALSNALLESAYALIQAQQSLDGIPLNAMPKKVLTSPTSWGLARRLTTPTNPTQASEINTFAGMITPISDANLSGARFYVFADPTELPCFIYGYLRGQSGPRTEVRPGFRSDGIEFKVSVRFGCGAIDYRGGVSGAGS